MDIKSFIEKMKLFEGKFLEFIEDESVGEKEFDNEIGNSGISSNQYELDEVLRIISKIANNHHRCQLFFKKIFQILLILKDSILRFYSNYEIFNIFKNNKVILLFLFKQQIITTEQSIFNIITSNKYQKRNYHIYFYNEFRYYYSKKMAHKCHSIVNSYLEKGDDLFDENRMNGENEDFICYLIRNDMIEDFIVYINKNSTSLSKSINPSIFESNPFLLKNKPNLIEYSAFYGSIQIFNYLMLNNVDFDHSKIWIYAIHGKNPEIIHKLEYNNVERPSNSYRVLLTESMKCYHCDIARYFKFNYVKYGIDQDDRFILQVIRHYSYSLLPEDLEIEDFLSYSYEIVKHGHIKIVDFLIKNVGMDINNISILNIYNFF